MVDWAGGNDTGPRPRKDAIWMAVVRQGRAEAPLYLRNRQVAEEALTETRSGGSPYGATHHGALGAQLTKEEATLAMAAGENLAQLALKLL